ncbi:Demethylsterigmatocystin 6-O-methyltransferase 5 [Colletotrichum chlorophyti]|uniref:Demethylsterigmatocystin 6-O-methyltransferase 5 n=1 Tax=Colletotrichum chlorophyti TaxID=708187 RepID=A0A1Q8RJE0_9PEZI|nr:Demethylsterigmatocystin 6-O-methyltransferase 5 [Colletotrichum chlorophyti]
MHKSAVLLQHKTLTPAVECFDWASMPKGARVVDIGGSYGDAVYIATKFPQLEYIVQDPPETLTVAQTAFMSDLSIESEIKSRVRFISSDFSQPQAAPDAYVYVVRASTHNTLDRDPGIILQNLRPALERNEKSRVVIVDTALDPPGSTSLLGEQQSSFRDSTMLRGLNANGNKLVAWKTLLGEVGMEIEPSNRPHREVPGTLTTKLKHSAPDDINELWQVRRPLMPATDERPVLIIGAGVSGLCLAQALRKVNIPFLVFERDSAIDSRPQGYRLKLREDAEVALAESLPEDVYQHFLSSCAILAVGETDFNPFTGEVTKSRPGGGLSGKLGLCPSHTVDRTILRSILTMGIEDRIHFSKQLAHHNVNREQGSVSVTFIDGERVEGRFLVGADGLHSVVRPGVLPEHKIKDTGAACVYGKTPLTTEFANRFPEKGLRWMTVVSDQAPMLQSCHIGDASVTLLTEPTRFSEESRSKYPLPEDYVYWVLIAPQARFCSDGELPVAKVGSLNQQQAAAEAARLSLAVTEEWHPSIRSVFELQDMRQATFVRIISSMPDIPAWEPSAMVTLLGDAIHPMSPCGGVGAQTAICDAASLAKTLAETHGCPTAGDIGTFEEGMRERGRRSILQSETGSRKMFGLGSLEECKPWTGY